MNKRVLTIVVEVDQDSTDHKWIWDSLLHHEYINGVKVFAVAEGDLTDINLEKMNGDDED